MVTPDPSEFQQSLTKDRASPTPFADATARRKAVLPDRHLRSACSRGSNGGEHKDSWTTSKSHEGTRTACEGYNRRAPLRKWLTRGCDPTVRPSTKIYRAEMAATYTLMIETESSLSSNIYKYLSNVGTEQRSGSTC